MIKIDIISVVECQYLSAILVLTEINCFLLFEIQPECCFFCRLKPVLRTKDEVTWVKMRIAEYLLIYAEQNRITGMESRNPSAYDSNQMTKTA